MVKIRFTDDVIKEFRRLARDYKHRDAYIAALTKIYTTGYDNATADAAKRIQEAVRVNNKSPNHGYDTDGIILQSNSGLFRGGDGTDAVDADSSEGSDINTFLVETNALDQSGFLTD